MVDVHKAKVNKSDEGYKFTDEFGCASLSLTLIAREYGINYDDAKKICQIYNGKYDADSMYDHWYFPTEDDAIAALVTIKLMRS